MARSRISQKLGMSRLKFAEPRWPLLERLNQQAPQQSDPPFGMCPTSSPQPLAQRSVPADAVVRLPVLRGQQLRLLPQRLDDIPVQQRGCRSIAGLA